MTLSFHLVCVQVEVVEKGSCTLAKIPFLVAVFERLTLQCVAVIGNREIRKIFMEISYVWCSEVSCDEERPTISE